MKKKLATVPEVEEEVEDLPTPLQHVYPHLRSVLDAADVVLHVLDARDPSSFRSAHLERVVAARPTTRLLFVLNKIGVSPFVTYICVRTSILLIVNMADACPRETVAAWITHLRTRHPALLFRAASLFLPSAAAAAADVVIFKPKAGETKTQHRADDALGADSILACLNQWAQEKEGGGPLVVAVVGVVNVCLDRFHLGHSLLVVVVVAHRSYDSRARVR